MEVVAAQSMSEYNRYGSDVYKQVYVYGFLDRSPTALTINFGFSWGMGGWLLTHFLEKAGLPKMMEMRARVTSNLKTTFAYRLYLFVLLFSRRICCALATDATSEFFDNQRHVLR